MSYILAGALGGAGDHIMKQAAEAKKQAERERQEARQDRIRAEDRTYKETWRDEGRAYTEGRESARATADTNVYKSLFGTESGGNFGAQNKEGYTGRSQFGEARLKDFTNAMGIGPISMDQFKADPKLQKKAEKWHFEDINNYIDKNDLMRFEGQTIGGVKITRSGIIAMAHLGGSGGAKKFLESGGKYNPSDNNKTSLADYARTHGGKDTSMDGIWDTLADPNVSPALRDKAAVELGRRAGLGSKSEKLTGEEWVERDGKEVLMGRNDKGQMVPYTGKDGQPFTRKPKASTKPRQLSSGISDKIDQWASQNALPDDVVRKFKLKTEEFMAGGMTEIAAWDATLAIAEKSDDETITTEGFLGTGIGAKEKVRPGTYSGAFKEERSGGLGPAPRREAQATPSAPKDPKSPTAKPQIGEVMDGYEFMGGDPSDEKNWRKV